ncbi:shikimate kinase AroK [Conyzicola nivalis]|uniref:Shikimate kinase n=1 Tax=Conyzicola nivalis TaxID=1477021 RepID=A0A916WFR9_9MICO|nr:shikimate kinase [Conyzicola nivalis]GGA96545.1 shikimate kinase [Conyzicola nivalis]
MNEPDPAASARPVLVLIGAPGAGKSRLGKRVAKLLDVPFVDTDKRIVAEHGSIADLFAEHGEPHFRAIEREHVAAALREGAVVALGGGAVLDENTQRDLADHRVVQLTVTAEAVAKRITGGKRPLVDGVEAWSALVDTRRPIYDRLAQRTFDTSSLPIDHIAADIVGWIQETSE